MKKRSCHEPIDRNNRSSNTRTPHMTARTISVSNIPESIAQAYEKVRALVERRGNLSLDELQGAVEYLLDIVKAARSQNR